MEMISDIINNASNTNLGFAQYIDKQTILIHIMPCVKELVTDTSQHVRASLATQISGLAPILGKEAYV